MTHRLPRAAWIAIALALALGAILYWMRRGSSDSQWKYDGGAVERGRIVARVTATGTLSALVTVQVGSQVSGQIQHLFADFNSPVEKGELIAKIDPALFEAALEQAKANVLAADGNLAKARVQALNARRQAGRSHNLAGRKLIAEADADTAEATAGAAEAGVKAAEGALEQAKASAHQADVNLKYTDIVSPINGVVVSRNVDVGQTVAASLQAPILFTIAEDLHKMQVDTSVAEADIGRLSAGMKATFSVDAYPSDRFEGKVRQIRHAPQTVQNVVTYDAVIDVDNAELKLQPGMTANVTFVYAERDDVLNVPNAALRFRPPPELMAKLREDGAAAAEKGGAGGPAGGGGGHFGRRQGGGASNEAPDRRTVWVLRDHRPTPVRVRVGISDGTRTEIVEGELKPGDEVITDASGGTPRSGPPGMGPGPGGGFRRVF